MIPAGANGCALGVAPGVRCLHQQPIARPGHCDASGVA